jgi:hypothetical protein
MRLSKNFGLAFGGSSGDHRDQQCCPVSQPTVHVVGDAPARELRFCMILPVLSTVFTTFRHCGAGRADYNFYREMVAGGGGMGVTLIYSTVLWSPTVSRHPGHAWCRACPRRIHAKFQSHF